MAIVSSTTPRFGPMCPPVFATLMIRRSRIPAASRSSSIIPSRFTSPGDLILLKYSLILRNPFSAGIDGRPVTLLPTFSISLWHYDVCRGIRRLRVTFRVLSFARNSVLRCNIHNGRDRVGEGLRSGRGYLTFRWSDVVRSIIDGQGDLASRSHVTYRHVAFRKPETTSERIAVVERGVRAEPRRVLRWRPYDAHHHIVVFANPDFALVGKAAFDLGRNLQHPGLHAIQLVVTHQLQVVVVR